MIQLIGYGFAGLLRTLLVWPTYALFPNQLPSISLLQSMHFSGLLNRKKMKYFWIGNYFQLNFFINAENSSVFGTIFCWVGEAT
jgi:hypothetical protein